MNSQPPDEMEVWEALNWVPCGNHPARVPAECSYCAIDTLYDEVKSLRKKLSTANFDCEKVRADQWYVNYKKAESALITRDKQIMEIVDAFYAIDSEDVGTGSKFQRIGEVIERLAAVPLMELARKEKE